MAAIISLLAAGCAADVTQSPGQSSGAPSGETTTATDAPSISPARGTPSLAATPDETTTRSPAATQKTVVLPRDSIAKVVTDGLRVRTEPRVAADSKKLDHLLSKGMKVYVVDGPTRASGYDWYLVRPLVGAEFLPSGWVAAADHDGTPWLGPVHLECPSAPDLKQLGRMNRHVALACYRAREFRFEGVLTSSMASCEVYWSTEPSWLDDCYAAHYLAADAGAGNPGLDGTPVLEVRLEPGVERKAGIPDEPYGMLLPVAVVGGFDDPAAAACRLPAGYDSAGTPPPAIIVLDCRASFVGSAVMVLTGPEASR